MTARRDRQCLDTPGVKWDRRPVAQSPNTRRSRKRILIVDDEVSVRLALETLLRKRGYRYSSARSAAEAAELLQGNEYDMVITDMKMESKDSGLQVIRSTLAKNPATPVLVITGFADVESAVQAMKHGAYEFIEKPFQIDEIEAIIEQALRRRRRVSVEPEAGSPDGDPFAGIVGTDPAIQEIFRTIESIADTDATTLITGETGTGKELIARAIHRSSPRASQYFVTVNCGAIPESLLEAELFGSRKGSFTGATHDRPGRFQVADRGTSFLDEIGDMPVHMQVKLLRVLAEGEVQPIGATHPTKLNVRVVAATHQDLEESVQVNKFRADLFYRLNVIQIHIPPLRERPGDVVELAVHFMRQANRSQRRAVTGISADAQRALIEYPWPGNIRELENAVERVVILKRDGIIERTDLPAKVQTGGHVPRRGVRLKTRYVSTGGDTLLPSGPDSVAPEEPSSGDGVTAEPSMPSAPVLVESPASAVASSSLHVTLPTAGIDLRKFIAEVEYSLIDQALERCDGNRSKAAQLLGLNRTTLVERLKKRERRS
jgi:DNA-binding NtrC family response regulator